MRSYDILSVIGIAVLMLATPAYYAQDPAARPLADGATFATPGPRAGSFIEYELIVRIDGQEAASTGTVLRIDYRGPTESERAVGAAAAVEVHRPAKHVRFGPSTFTQDEAHDHVLFDPDLKRLQSLETEWISRESLITEPAASGVAARATTERSDIEGSRVFVPPMWQNTVYEPQRDLADLIPRLFHRTSSNEQQTPEPEPMQAGVERPSEDATRAAPFAAIHRGTALYAKDVQNHGFDRQELDLNAEAFGDPYRTLENESGPAYIGFSSSLGAFHLVWEGPFGGVTNQRQSWRWHAEELPAFAGQHVELRRDDGTRWLELDLVVRDHDEGDGPVLLDIAGSGDSAPGEAPGEAWPRSALPELEEDPRPFIDDLDLKQLRQSLERSATPAEVMEWVNAGAMIDGFVWERLNDGTSRWLIHLALPDGRTTGVSARLDDDGMREVEIACGQRNLIENRLTLNVRCQATATESQPNDLLPHPTDLLERLRSWDGLAGATEVIGLYAPSGGIQTILPGMSNSWYTPAFLVGTSEEGEVIAATDWSNGETYRRVALSEETGHLGKTLRPQEPEPSSAPQMVDPLGPEAAYGGLALVLLGLLFRLVSALKAGAHLPLLAPLYAKITRDKALLHEHRETIHALVAADPGVTIGEVVERSGLSRTGAFHHLETLGKNGLVTVTTIGRTRHYFPAEMKDPRVRMQVAVRRNPDWDAVLAAVEAHPGAALHELLPHVPQGKSALSRVGTRLERLGLVRKEPDGRTVRFFPTSSSADPEPLGRASS